MKGIKTGGKVKGSKNKSTLEIKELLDSTIDFSLIIAKLFELTQGITVRKGENTYSQPPDATAAKILLEYRFGKPLQTVQANIEVTDLTITRKIIGSSS